MEQLKIKTYCHIKNENVYINGKLVFEYPEATGITDFLKKAFKHFKPGYTTNVINHIVTCRLQCFLMPLPYHAIRSATV